MNRQWLLSPGPASAAGIVQAFGAVQSQDYAGARWAVGQRGAGLTDAAVARDFDAGRILRTHVLRPTWHFVVPADIRWMVALTRGRIAAAMASYNRKLELDASVFRRTHRVLERALGGGTHLTRTELKAELTRAGVRALGTQRLAHIMMQGELDLVVCSGPRRGKQFTYALLDERVPGAKERTRDESLLELARRYFRMRSPATLHDFAWWSGLAMADARRAIDVAGRELTPLARGSAYLTTEGPAMPRRSARRAHLLPNYDEYFIGYKDRSAIGVRFGTARVTGGNALIANVVALDGQLVGGWKRVESRGTTRVTFDLPVSVSATERRLIDRAVAEYEQFLGPRPTA